MRIILLFFSVGLIATTLVWGQSQNAVNPYPGTSGSTNNGGIDLVKITPSQINVISARVGKRSSNLEIVIKNYMFLWIQTESPGSSTIEWHIQSPADGLYDVTAVMEGQGNNIVLACNGQRHDISVEEKEWTRTSLGSIHLKSGLNTLQMNVLPRDAEAAKNFKLSALELTQPAIKETILKEALHERQSTRWFRDAGYGVMFQWTNRATPPEGAVKEWADKVNDFDIKAFADMVEETGAAYVIWSVTWGEQYISAPIQSLDRIIEARTTEWDLLGEMADLLDERGIKLIFYYHYGYDCYHSQDSVWLEAAGGYKADKSELYDNIIKIVSEIGNRYGDRLHGWFFDGGQRYYDTHFDGSSAGILSAPFKEISQAARSGNSNRILAYNSWILPRLTEYQDYYAGEGLKQYKGLEDGIFADGPQKGLMAHTCFPLEKRWGHIDLNTAIESPKYTLEQLIDRIRQAQNNRYPLSINLEMYENGSVSAESLELLKNVRAIIRDKRKTSP